MERGNLGVGTGDMEAGELQSAILAISGLKGPGNSTCANDLETFANTIHYIVAIVGLVVANKVIFVKGDATVST